MKWHLTQAVIGEPEIDVREDDEDPTRGYSLLRMMAEEPGSSIREISLGVWYQSKLPEGDME